MNDKCTMKIQGEISEVTIAGALEISDNTAVPVISAQTKP